MLRQVIRRMCYFFFLCGIFGAYKMITDPAFIIRKLGGPLDGWDLWCGWSGVVVTLVTAGHEAYFMLREDFRNMRSALIGHDEDADEYDE